MKELHMNTIVQRGNEELWRGVDRKNESASLTLPGKISENGNEEHKAKHANILREPPTQCLVYNGINGSC